MSSELSSDNGDVSPLSEQNARHRAGIKQVRCGVDTFSICFASPQAARDLRDLSLAHEATRGPGPAGVKLRRKGLTISSQASAENGISVGGFYAPSRPDQGVVWVEGRLSAFLASDPSISTLAPVTDLARAEASARALFVESLGIGLGLQADGPAEFETFEWEGANTEPLRIDDANEWAGVRQNVWIAGGLLVAGLVVALVMWRRDPSSRRARA